MTVLCSRASKSEHHEDDKSTGRKPGQSELCNLADLYSFQNKSETHRASFWAEFSSALCTLLWHLHPHTELEHPTNPKLNHPCYEMVYTNPAISSQFTQWNRKEQAAQIGERANGRASSRQHFSCTFYQQPRLNCPAKNLNKHFPLFKTSQPLHHKVRLQLRDIPTNTHTHTQNVLLLVKHAPFIGVTEGYWHYF